MSTIDYLRLSLAVLFLLKGLFFPIFLKLYIFLKSITKYVIRINFLVLSKVFFLGISYFIIFFGDDMGLNVGVYVKGNALILRLKGELDDLSVSDLRTRISRYIDDYKIKHLIINVEKLDFMDSSGIGFIIGRFHQLKRVNGDVMICNINQKIEKIIHLSGLSKICMIRENEESVFLTIGGN